MCNGPQTNCRLTLRLFVTTDVVNTTRMSGSTPVSTYLVTTTSLVGDMTTAVVRIQPSAPKQSSKGGGGKFRGPPAPSDDTAQLPAPGTTTTSNALDLGRDPKTTGTSEDLQEQQRNSQDATDSDGSSGNSNNTSDDRRSLTAGQIIGITVGSVALLSSLSLGVFLVLRYRKHRLAKKEMMSGRQRKRPNSRGRGVGVGVIVPVVVHPAS